MYQKSYSELTLDLGFAFFTHPSATSIMVSAYPASFLRGVFVTHHAVTSQVYAAYVYLALIFRPILTVRVITSALASSHVSLSLATFSLDL